ncbi:MAG TPA: flagellin lysine-N-methylase [Geobacteraceae bacterium]
MPNFRCICGDCEDLCCTELGIEIDAESAGRYQSCEDPELRAVFDRYLVELPERDGRNTHRINFAAEGSCPLLDEGKLCGLQKRYGEEALSLTCSVYPRYASLVDDVVEYSATTSCPEIVRAALLPEAPISFTESREEEGRRKAVMHVVRTADPQGVPALRHFRAVRGHCIRLLQDRRFQLWERLILLGFFVRRLQEEVDAGRGDGIVAMVGESRRQLDDPQLHGQLAAISVHAGIQLALLGEITALRGALGAINPRLTDCINEFAAGLGFGDAPLDAAAVARFGAAHDRWFVPFMEERGHILENYLVNIVFREVFPFAKVREPFAAYVELALYYALIKMLLVGMAAHRGGIDEEAVVKVIQSFSKGIEHSPLFRARLLEILRKNRFNTLGYMAILVKN